MKKINSIANIKSNLISFTICLILINLISINCHKVNNENKNGLDFEKILCGEDGKFLNSMLGLNERCEETFRKKCDVELKLTPENTVDKKALMDTLEQLKEEIRGKGVEVIAACDKDKLERIKAAQDKVSNGRALNEREKILVGLQSNERNYNASIREGRRSNLRDSVTGTRGQVGRHGC